MHWPHRLPLACVAIHGAVLAGTVPTIPPPPSFQDFLPSRHGFNFTNSFSGSPIPGALGSLAPGIGPSHFGLCGGMSTAAADYFMWGIQTPTREKPPLKGDWLFDLLQQRQGDSLGTAYAMVPVFAAWMSAPDNDWMGVRHATAASIGPIAAKMESHQPAVVGLVRVKGGQGKPIWENHQVLATRADKLETGVYVLHIYDPNYPRRDDVVITCTPAVVGVVELPGNIGIRSPIMGYTCQQTVGGRKVSNIRGLFAMPYAAKKPPEHAAAAPPPGIDAKRLAAIEAELATLARWPEGDAGGYKQIESACAAYDAILDEVKARPEFKDVPYKEPDWHLLGLPKSGDDDMLKIGYAHNVLALMEQRGILTMVEQAAKSSRVSGKLTVTDGLTRGEKLVPRRQLGRALIGLTIARARSGDIDQAIRGLSCSLTISMSMSWEPTLINMLSSVSLDEDAFDECGWLASSGLCKPEQLAALQELLKTRTSRCGLPTLLPIDRDEIALSVWRSVQPEKVIREAFGEKADNLLKARELMRTVIGTTGKPDAELSPAQCDQLATQTLAAFDLTAAEVGKPPHTWPDGFTKRERPDENRTLRDLMEEAHVDAIPYTAVVEWRRETRLRSTRAIIAIEQFRLANKQLPESLSKLLPTFLDSVPNDPWSDKPMLFRVASKDEQALYRRQYLLYSTGLDRTDNGARMGLPAYQACSWRSPGLDYDLNPPRDWWPPQEMHNRHMQWPPQAQEN